MDNASTPMLSAHQRLCDVCTEVIPAGVTYRVGYTTPDTVEPWVEDDPELLPSFTQEDSGIVRFDVCSVCAGESEGFEECTEPVVDALH